MIIYRQATIDDIHPAFALALRSFIEFQLPDYEPQALSHFKTCHIDNETYIEDYRSGRNTMFVALDGDKMVGMINEHGTNHHISEMAVDGKYQRQGIGTALMDIMVCKLKMNRTDRIELAASPHGLPFYLAYGFMPTDDEKHLNGFIFTPMTYAPNEIWDVLDKDGNKTGRYHERGRKMAVGDYHLCVHVWKYNRSGEWLIDKRVPKSADDNNGGKWETTGGAVIAGEDSLTAALRETKEELGLNLEPAKGILFRRFAREGYFGHTYLMDVWVFEHDCAIDGIHYQASETCEAKWATAEQIRQLIKDHEFFNDVDLYFDEMTEKWGVPS